MALCGTQAVEEALLRIESFVSNTRSEMEALKSQPFDRCICRNRHIR